MIEYYPAGCVVVKSLCQIYTHGHAFEFCLKLLSPDKKVLSWVSILLRCV